MGVEVELENTTLAWPAHNPKNSTNEQTLG